MTANPGCERWEATWEEGRITEDRLGDHTAMRYRHFRQHVDAEDGIALDEVLFGFVLSAEGIRDEMKQYEKATAIVRLAETGFFVRKLRQMNSLLDAVRDSYEVEESPELADWRTGLQQERGERMDVYNELLATDCDSIDGDGASDRMWEFTDDLEIEEALTLLKSGIEKYIDDTLTEQEISTIQTAFNMIAKHSGMIVTTIPDWFVSPFSFGGSFGLSRWGNDLFVPEQPDRDRVVRDANIWSRLNHPHIVKFLGACHVGTRPFFVHEKVKPLIEVLSGVPDREIVWRRLHEVALCLLYLSERGLGFGDFSIDDVCCAQYEDKAMMRGVGLIEAKAGLVRPGYSSPSSNLPLSALVSLDMRALGFCVYEALNLLEKATENHRTHSYDKVDEKTDGRSRELPAARPSFITEEEWRQVVLRLTANSQSISAAIVVRRLNYFADLEDHVENDEIPLITKQLAGIRDFYGIEIPSFGESLGKLVQRCVEDICQPLTRVLARILNVLEQIVHREFQEMGVYEIAMLIVDTSTLLHRLWSLGKWLKSDSGQNGELNTEQVANWIWLHTEIDRLLMMYDMSE